MTPRLTPIACTLPSGSPTPDGERTPASATPQSVGVQLPGELWLTIAQTPNLSSLDVLRMRMVSKSWQDLLSDDSVWRAHVPQVIVAVGGDNPYASYAAWRHTFDGLPTYIQQTLAYAAQRAKPVPNLFTRGFAYFVETHADLDRREAIFSPQHMKSAFKDFKKAAEAIGLKVYKGNERRQTMVHEAIDAWIQTGRGWLAHPYVWDVSRMVNNEAIVRDTAVRYNYPSAVTAINVLMRDIKIQNIKNQQTRLLSHLYNPTLLAEDLAALDIACAEVGFASGRQAISLFQRTLGHFDRDPTAVTLYGHAASAPLHAGPIERQHGPTAQNLALNDHVLPALTQLFSQPLCDACLVQITTHLTDYETAFDALRTRFEAAPQKSVLGTLDGMLAKLMRDIRNDAGANVTGL